MQSKPGPMFAIEAGTLTLTRAANHSDSRDYRTFSGSTVADSPDYRQVSQLQDLSECAGVSVQLDWRFDVFQRRVGVFEPGTGQHHDRDRILVDLAVADQAEQERERRRRRGLREEALAA